MKAFKKTIRWRLFVCLFQVIVFFHRSSAPPLSFWCLASEVLALFKSEQKVNTRRHLVWKYLNYTRRNNSHPCLLEHWARPLQNLTKETMITMNFCYSPQHLWLIKIFQTRLGYILAHHFVWCYSCKCHICSLIAIHLCQLLSSPNFFLVFDQESCSNWVCLWQPVFERNIWLITVLVSVCRIWPDVKYNEAQ